MLINLLMAISLAGADIEALEAIQGQETSATSYAHSLSADMPAPKPRAAVGSLSTQGQTQTLGPEPANVVWVKPGETLRLPISARDPNRIVTPFGTAQLATNAEVQYEERQGTIYVSAVNEHPFGGFILSGEDSEAPAISVLLEPKAIPLQEYVLKIRGYRRSSRSQQVEPRRQQDYVTELVALLKEAASTGRIRGYSHEVIERGDILYIGPVRAELVAIYERRPFRVERLMLTNESDQALELVEENFYEPGVRAVGFWPPGELAPNQSASLFRVRGVE